MKIILPVERLVKKSFFKKTLPNIGYSNMYKAICDIVDNSIEPSVGSTFVRVETDGKSNEPMTKIRIIDNGCGMDFDTLVNAISIGDSEKDESPSNHGKYGTGLKSASLFIGKRFEIYTKQRDGKLLHAVYDISEELYVMCEDVTDEETIKSFKDSVGGENGTIVEISKFDEDKISTRNVYSFTKTLSDKLGLYYNKFIFSNECEFYVGKTKVHGIDPIGKNVDGADYVVLMPETKITLDDGCEITVSAYKIGDVDKNNENLREVTKKHAGLYVYRNKRLIGEGLNYGVLGEGSKHPSFNGYRVEISCDASSDKLWGCQIAKEIPDKTKREANETLYNKLHEVLAPSKAEYLRFISVPETYADEEDQDEYFNEPVTDKEKSWKKHSHLLKSFPKDGNGEDIANWNNSVLDKNPNDEILTKEKIKREATLLDDFKFIKGYEFRSVAGEFVKVGTLTCNKPVYAENITPYLEESNIVFTPINERSNVLVNNKRGVAYLITTVIDGKEYLVKNGQTGKTMIERVSSYNSGNNLNRFNGTCSTTNYKFKQTIACGVTMNLYIIDCSRDNSTLSIGKYTSSETPGALPIQIEELINQAHQDEFGKKMIGNTQTKK